MATSTVPAWFNNNYYLNSKLEYYQASFQYQTTSTGLVPWTSIQQVQQAILSSGLTVYQDFLQNSLAQNTSPDTGFNTRQYLEAKAFQVYGDEAKFGLVQNALAAAGFTNAYDHYKAFGWKEGLNASNRFDTNAYVQDFADARGITFDAAVAAMSAAGLDPVSHYFAYGYAEGLVPENVPVGERVAVAASWFNEDFYLNSKLEQIQSGSNVSSGPLAWTDVQQIKAAINAAGMTVYQHYLQFSLQEGTSPDALFNTKEYLQSKAIQMGLSEDQWSFVGTLLQDAGYTNAYQHYLQWGWKEGTNPSNGFDTDAYIAAVAADKGISVVEFRAQLIGANLSPLSYYYLYGDVLNVPPVEVPVGERVSGQDFVVTASSASVSEGMEVTFELSTHLVKPGTEVGFVVEGTGNAAQVSVTGSFVVGKDGVAHAVVVLPTNAIYGDVGTLRLVLDNNQSATLVTVANATPDPIAPIDTQFDRATAAYADALNTAEISNTIADNNIAASVGLIRTGTSVLEAQQAVEDADTAVVAATSEYESALEALHQAMAAVALATEGLNVASSNVSSATVAGQAAKDLAAANATTAQTNLLIAQGAVSSAAADLAAARVLADQADLNLASVSTFTTEGAASDGARAAATASAAEVDAAMVLFTQYSAEASNLLLNGANVADAQDAVVAARSALVAATKAAADAQDEHAQALTAVQHAGAERDAAGTTGNTDNLLAAVQDVADSRAALSNAENDEETTLVAFERAQAQVAVAETNLAAVAATLAAEAASEAALAESNTAEGLAEAAITNAANDLIDADAALNLGLTVGDAQDALASANTALEQAREAVTAATEERTQAQNALDAATAQRDAAGSAQNPALLAAAVTDFNNAVTQLAAADVDLIAAHGILADAETTIAVAETNLAAVSAAVAAEAASEAALAESVLAGDVYDVEAQAANTNLLLVDPNASTVDAAQASLNAANQALVEADGAVVAAAEEHEQAHNALVAATTQLNAAGSAQNANYLDAAQTDFDNATAQLAAANLDVIAAQDLQTTAQNTVVAAQNQYNAVVSQQNFENGVFSLTTGFDDLTGRAVENDTFLANLADLDGGASNTLNDVDIITGGASKNDTIKAQINESVTPLSITQVENLVVQSLGTASPITLDLINSPDFVSINATGGTGDLEIDNITNLVTDLEVSNTVGSTTTFNYMAGAGKDVTLVVDPIDADVVITNANKTAQTVDVQSVGLGPNILDISGANGLGLLTVTVSDNPDATDAENLAQQLTIKNTAANVTYIGATGALEDGVSDGTGFTGQLTATLSASGTLIGGVGNDTLTGSSSNDLIFGNAGADTINAGAGLDEVHGGDGNDTLLGQDDGDLLLGEAGNDTITAGKGADELFGGTGSDTISALDGGLYTVVAGTDADTVNLANDTKADVVDQNVADSVTATVANDTGGTIVVGTTLTFAANGLLPRVDIVNNFETGVDKLNVVSTVGLAGLIGRPTGNLAALAQPETFYTYGTYVGGVFTVGVGPDTLVVQTLGVGDATSNNLNNSNASSVVLLNVNLVQGDFDVAPYRATGNTVLNTTSGDITITNEPTIKAQELVDLGYTRLVTTLGKTLTIDARDQTGSYFNFSNLDGDTQGANNEFVGDLVYGTVARPVTEVLFSSKNGANTYQTNAALFSKTVAVGGSGLQDNLSLAVGAGLDLTVNLQLGTITDGVLTGIVRNFENIDAATLDHALTATLVNDTSKVITSALTNTLNVATAAAAIDLTVTSNVAFGKQLELNGGNAANTVTVNTVASTLDAKDLDAKLLANLDNGTNSITVTTGTADTTITVDTTGKSTVSIDGTAGGAGDTLTVGGANTDVTIGVTQLNQENLVVDKAFSGTFGITAVGNTGHDLTNNATGITVTGDVIGAAAGKLIETSGVGGFTLTNLKADLTNTATGPVAVTLKGTGAANTWTIDSTSNITVNNGDAANDDTVTIKGVNVTTVNDLLADLVIEGANPVGEDYRAVITTGAIAAGVTTVTSELAAGNFSIDANKAVAGTVQLVDYNTTTGLTDFDTVDNVGNGVIVDAAGVERDLGVTTKSAISTSIIIGQADNELVGSGKGGSIAVDAHATTDGSTLTLTGNEAGAKYLVGLVSGNELASDLIQDGDATVDVALDNVTTLSIENNGAGLTTVYNGLFAAGSDLAVSGKGAFDVGVIGGEFIGDLTAGAGAGALNVRIGDLAGTATQIIDSDRAATILAGAVSDVGGTNTLELNGTGAKAVNGLAASLNINVSDAGAGAITIAAADLVAGKTLTLLDTGVTGPLITVNALEDGDVSAATYAGDLEITAGGGAATKQTITLGSGTNDVNFDGSTLTSGDAINGSAGTKDTLNVTGNNAIGDTALQGTVDIETVTFANTTTNVAVTTVNGNFTKAGTYEYNAGAIGANTFTFIGTDNGNGSLAQYKVVSAAGDDSITGAGNADIVYAGAGKDTITGAGGADQLFGENGNDTFKFSTLAEIQTKGLVVNGGNDTDTLEFTASIGAIDLSAVTGLTNVEILKLDNGSSGAVILDTEMSAATVVAGAATIVLSAATGQDVTSTGAGNLLVQSATAYLTKDVALVGDATKSNTLQVTDQVASALDLNGAGVTGPVVIGIQHLTLDLGSTAVVTLDADMTDATVTKGAAQITLSAADQDVAGSTGASAGNLTVNTKATYITGNTVISGAATTDNTLNITDVVGVALSLETTPTLSNIDNLILAAGSTAMVTVDSAMTLVTLGNADATVELNANGQKVNADSLADSKVLTLTDTATTSAIVTLTDGDLAAGTYGGALTVSAGIGSNVITTGDGNDTIDAGAGVDTITTGNGTNQVIGGAGADAITLGTGTDTLIFTTALSADTLSGFAVGTDKLDYDLSEFNSITGAKAGATSMSDGFGDAVTAGATVVFQAITGAVTNLTSANVLNITAAGLGSVADVETLLENGNLSAALGHGIDANDTIAIQWVEDLATDVYHTAVVIFNTAVAGGVAVGDVTVSDVAVIGTTASTAADWAFVA